MTRSWPCIRLPEGGRMTAFDDWADGLVERRLRGRPVPDRVFYTASAVGDHGILWLTIALLQAGRRRPGWQRRLVRAAVGLGLESALVNGPVKWLFRRERPDHPGPRPLHLRQPRTSSFPSGHATAAFFAAAVLGEDDPLRPLYYGLGIIVAGSRLHVRIHHASDVVGGIVIGTLLGQVATRAVPLRPGPPTGGEESPGPAAC